MGRPVLVDDGGSIRIRRIDGNGAMDGLLNLEQHLRQEEDPYKKAFIGWVTAKGEAGTYQIGKFDTILVSAELNQSVEVRLHSGELNIRAFSTAAANPIIDCKSSNIIRSYTVVNSGNIAQIAVNGVTVNGIPRDAIYIGVVIT